MERFLSRGPARQGRRPPPGRQRTEMRTDRAPERGQADREPLPGHRDPDWPVRAQGRLQSIGPAHYGQPDFAEPPADPPGSLRQHLLGHRALFAPAAEALQMGHQLPGRHQARSGRPSPNRGQRAEVRRRQHPHRHQADLEPQPGRPDPDRSLPGQGRLRLFGPAHHRQPDVARQPAADPSGPGRQHPLRHRRTAASAPAQGLRVEHQLPQRTAVRARRRPARGQRTEVRRRDQPVHRHQADPQRAPEHSGPDRPLPGQGRLFAQRTARHRPADLTEQPAADPAGPDRQRLHDRRAAASPAAPGLHVERLLPRRPARQGRRLPPGDERA